jgi:hypothetical protein
MNPTTTDPNPLHQPETLSTAEVQKFESPALPPTDPEVQARIRKGRPRDANLSTESRDSPGKD